MNRIKLKSSHITIMVILSVLCVLYGWRWVKTDYTQFTVTDKLRVEGRYLIYTDKGVYENTNSWSWLKTRSSDYYAKLKVGSTYKVTTYGFRNGILDMYPNIVNIED